MTKVALTIYCDESIEKGRYFSDFYGGLIIPSNRIEPISQSLLAACKADHLNHEIKWTKVTANYLDKYIRVIDHFFTFIYAGEIRLRIMFRKNAYTQADFSSIAMKKKYFKLYYQFIKHAFDLTYHPDPDSVKELSIFYDEIPDRKVLSQEFRQHIIDLQNLQQWRDNHINIISNRVGEVNSKHHILMQCLDIVLGSMAFRLNDHHKDIPEGKSRRGKRTLAKEALYKHIRSKICEIKPNFNVGVSTKIPQRERYHFPYAHWSFKPKDFEMDISKHKSQAKGK